MANEQEVRDEIARLVTTIFGMPEGAESEADYWGDVKDALTLMVAMGYLLAVELDHHDEGQCSAGMPMMVRANVKSMLRLAPLAQTSVDHLLFKR